MSHSPTKASFGKVYLVGAGPGDPGLLTLKAKGLLDHADVVVHDALVSPPILAMIAERSHVIDAGKRRGRHSMAQTDITQLLIEQAKHHAVVVRLKGGDPFVFGRGGEEMMGLLEAGIDVEVVPGITAGIAAPAYAGIPVTHRDYSSSVTFVTGHEAVGKYRPKVNWAAVAQGSETIVIYMGVHNLPNIVAELTAAGMSATTPIALVRWGTRPEHEELIGSLETIVQQVQDTQFQAPAIAIIGRVVDLYEVLAPVSPIHSPHWSMIQAS
ncbi:uroporphyrinogen-III C-methyltransferase [Leptothoe kymatousa]|uniref:uroporphyrinogen-III C-methyltransferase n=1 Tax=Leptothoe kymatousa TAU-MAC 1615 TaxID=2364775 RepID=A0ABS5Y2P8_9CYAN|nr:uroporphyrinogen-III C-methyltransferase [Leptothoe kymatousa]MBT9312090.1 uroporphyrinogen-III C-methyltransferase [Leptothoe kymatousa TAU-MAC 1615]